MSITYFFFFHKLFHGNDFLTNHYSSSSFIFYSIATRNLGQKPTADTPASAANVKCTDKTVKKKEYTTRERKYERGKEIRNRK
jgi:hypothetical protein